MSKKRKYITLLVAPGIPFPEIKALKKHWQEAEDGTNYAVVLNYECGVWLINTPRNAKYLVQAPGMPTGEISALRKRIDDAISAKKQKDRIVVCNYECRIDVV